MDLERLRGLRMLCIFGSGEEHSAAKHSRPCSRAKSGTAIITSTETSRRSAA
jgi:hypothetical protein